MAPRAAKSSRAARPAYCTVEQLTFHPHVFALGDRVDEILPPAVLEAVLANGEAAYAEADPAPEAEPAPEPEPEVVPDDPTPEHEPEVVPDEPAPDPEPAPEPEAAE